MKSSKTERTLYRKHRQGLFGRKILAVLVWVGLIFCAGHAPAADVALPPVNLGDTSFQDGIAFPGWLIEEVLGYNHAGRINDHSGNAQAGSDKFTSVSATTHVAYISNFRLLGGFYGAEILLPLADVDLNTSGPKDREQGIGDLIVSPFILQWTDHKLFGMPYYHRFVFDITLPTGSYDRNHAVNAGNNMVSINPYYALTIIPADKLEFSARLHYLWNSRNDAPYTGLGAGTVQPGQAFHANYAASYEVTNGVRLGLNGYALQQLSEDRINGRSLDNSQERVFGIGPGVQYSNNGISLYLNSYFETGVENRPEGTKVVFRISKTF